MPATTVRPSTRNQRLSFPFRNKALEAGMSKTIEVPDRDDDVKRIVALKPKVTKGEESLYSCDLAPIVRLIGQATSAVEDASQILLAYGRSEASWPEGNPWPDAVNKAAAAVTQLREAALAAHTTVAQTAIHFAMEERGTASR
jgi:hypothetical protein